VLGAKAHGEDGCVLDLSQAGQKLGEAFLPAEEQGDTLPQPGSVEITYIPIGGLHLYLICVIGWFSRCVVGRKDFIRHGRRRRVRVHAPGTGGAQRPSCANFDQGSLFSAATYKGLLAC
jgi:hypothetical protein